MTEIETLYELPNYAYHKYRKTTKGNLGISHERARMKLTRNILLGKTIWKDSIYNQRIVMYGALKIRINTTIDGREVITGIWNNCERVSEWKLHKKKFKKLNKRIKTRRKSV